MTEENGVKQVNDFLDINDLSYSERAALTNADLESYCNAAIMKAGIVIPPMPEPKIRQEIKLPEDKTVVHIVTDQFGKEVAFTDRNDAESLKASLENSSLANFDYEYFSGHGKVYTIDTNRLPNDVLITTTTVYEKSALINARREYEKFVKQNNDYDARLAIYKQANEFANEIREKIYESYNFACERERKISEYIYLYGEYLVYSKGDKTIAQQFLVNNIGFKLSQYGISILTIIDRYETMLENLKSTGEKANEC